MAGLLGDKFHRTVVLQRKVVDAGVHGEADDGATHVGICDGTAVAVFITIEEHVAGDVADAGEVLVLPESVEV